MADAIDSTGAAREWHPRTCEPSAGDAHPSPPGWYGKLPASGDFASRRLPANFVAPWDRWLAQCLSDSRARLAQAWLPAYLTCPVWRFLAMPGVIDATSAACWSGIVMPSVDYVGRHFPLTIAAPFPVAPSRGADILALWRWFNRIENVAMAALEFDRPLDWLDDQLATHPPPVVAGNAARERHAALDGLSLWAVLSQESAHYASNASASDKGHADAAPAAACGHDEAFTLWASAGLPDVDLFISLLTGECT